MLFPIATLLVSSVAAYSPTIQWISCHNHRPVQPSTNQPFPTSVKIPDTLHCGQIIVPMDYATPIGAENNISLGLAMYRPKNPKGVIFL
jgi:hypothetical protein